MKRFLFTLLKVGISVAIIGYLVYNATAGRKNANVFVNLWHQPKQWDMLLGAWVLCFVAVLLTFIRWWYLVLALDMPCRFADAIRISFWGFLFNLSPLGIAGGDLVKAVMLAHEQPGHRAKAVATVLVDRVIGLYVLFIVASAAILLTGFRRIDVPEEARAYVQWVCDLTFFITAASTVGLGILIYPGVTGGRLSRAVGRIPRVGRYIESLIDAVRMYKTKPLALTVALLMTVGVHLSFAAGCWMIARGLPGKCPSLAQHFVIMPLSAAMGTIPLPAGPFEALLKYFYSILVPGIADGQGLVVRSRTASSRC